LIGGDALATEAIWESLYIRLRGHGQKGLAIDIPQGPGLGIEIDRCALARFAV